MILSKWGLIIDFINEPKVAFDPGDGMVLYSDGITEAENIDGENYGLERLCRTISSCWHLSSEAVKDTVINDVRAHIGPQTVYDDLTIVVVKQQPEMV